LARGLCSTPVAVCWACSCTLCGKGAAKWNEKSDSGIATNFVGIVRDEAIFQQLPAEQENATWPVKQSADFDRGSAACFLPRKTLEWIQSGQRVQKTDSSAPDFLGAPRTVSASLVLAAQGSLIDR